MVIVKNIVISAEAPNLKEVGWLQPIEDGTFRLKFYGPAGWVDAASGVKGDKGDNGNSLRQFGPIISRTLAEVQTQIDKTQSYTEFTTANAQVGDTIIMLVQLTDYNNQVGILTGIIEVLTDVQCTIRWKSITYASQGTNGNDGKSVTAISLTTNEAGQVTGGTATLSDGSSIPITVAQS